MLQKIINLTKTLIKCPSISPFDAGCQDILITILKKLKFHIDLININNTNNFWAIHNFRQKNIHNTLVFAGHTDVVSPGNITKWKFNPFTPIIHDNILYGRGVCDMKGSLAAMIFAAKKFILNYPHYHGCLSFIITSDEEGNAKNGTIKIIKKLLKNKEKIDFCIIGEPTSKKIIGDNIKNGRRGSLNIQLEIIGIQGHVAYHNLAKNPIHMVIPLLKELIFKKWSKKNSLFPETSMQITKIKSNIEDNNIIPGNIIIYINFRFNNEISYKNILKKLNYMLKKYVLNFKIKWQLSGKPFLSNQYCKNKKKNLLNIVKQSIYSVNNFNPSLINDGGTSDGRFIIKTGAQIIELGLNNSTIHKINEHVHINDLYILYKIYYQIIKNIFLT
ncbi:succinyl-diaminopimelate desuccinylase [Enterobacteriaceae endosymbiont of Donacia cincticornis]|uniref:succinyl-diaminopimelate desuccinylase n=1 Tax=Enterobacteriaceae endosymbiont of Donacia cincticornis TaxID=2675773 RepID=UPI001449C110|nr:succinyl-diaminopimelate desuccinylase [Enterobacteriaceae endosymbiont of Donacia cincticornis]QJC36095.1 succinyl-diaminopimelate desuccinylase [Enterobacteriaceae endosymbiont of Donacia cincticornis]